MIGTRVFPLLLAWVVAMTQGAKAADAESRVADEIVVVGIASRGALSLDKIPAAIRSLSVDEIVRTGASTPTDALERRLGSIAVQDALGNAFSQSVTLRGFTSAPTLGEPQGVAVFQGATRLNENFGDIVRWDTVPLFAVDEIQVTPGSNPSFGLNAIGGAVILKTKDGFSSSDARVEAYGGSFGRASTTAEAGGARGAFGFYGGFNFQREDGFRDESPSRLYRGFSDLAWRSDDSEVGLSVTVADTALAGNGAAPTDLLGINRAAIFTFPDETDTRLVSAELRAIHEFAGGWRLQTAGNFRRLRISTVNGDQAEFEECEEFIGLVPGFSAPDQALCFGAEAEIEDGEIEIEGEPEILLDLSGAPLLLGGAVGDEAPGAVFNRTGTETDSGGISLQLSRSRALAGRDNVFLFGATAEFGRTEFVSETEIGELDEARGVSSLGATIGNEDFNVDLRTRRRDFGVYASNTLSLTPQLHLTAAGRWNRSTIRLRDQIGTALNGDHEFVSVSPGAGIVWNAAKAASVYLSFNRTTRIPSPAELSCADPEQPCRFPNAFLADPPLLQARARTIEGGLRGALNPDEAFRYLLSAYVTRVRDDIIFISAGPIIGTGFFDNVERTRRIGLDADFSGRAGRFDWYASYGFVAAAFASPLEILAPNNPFADEGGDITVSPGDRLPGVPAHTLKAGLTASIAQSLSAGAEFTASAGRFARGDEANLTGKTDPFALVNLHATYSINDRITLFARVDNLFDAEFESFAVFGEASELGFADPRFLTPGTPRAWRIGARARF